AGAAGDARLVLGRGLGRVARHRRARRLLCRLGERVLDSERESVADHDVDQAEEDREHEREFDRARAAFAATIPTSLRVTHHTASRGAAAPGSVRAPNRFDWRGCDQLLPELEPALSATSPSLPATAPNSVLRLVPVRVSAPMITTAISPAIRPYSIA